MRHFHRPSSIFVQHLATVAGALVLGACAAPVSTGEPEASESTGTVSSELFTSSVTFVKGGAPGYTIQVGNGLCLEAQPNANVLQARCAIGNPMQRWATTAGAGGATVRNAGNSRCLDVEGSPATGVNVNTFTCHGGSNQLFHVFANGGAFETTMTPGTVALGSRIVASGSALCLDLRGGTANGGERLQLFPCGGGSNQAFSIKGGPVAIGSAMVGEFGDADHVVEIGRGGGFGPFRLGPGERATFDMTPNLSWLSWDPTTSGDILDPDRGSIRCPANTTLGFLIRIPGSDDYRMTCMR